MSKPETTLPARRGDLSLALRTERRVTEQFAQHENIYMQLASDLDRNRLWRLRDTVVRVVTEEIERP